MQVDNDQRYLASYVGLGPKLANVAKLFLVEAKRVLYGSAPPGVGA